MLAMVAGACLCLAGSADARTVSKPTLGGTVWRDADKDGIRDRGEHGAAKARVKLFRGLVNTGRIEFVSATRTNARGRWSFTISKAGFYRAVVVPPRGTGFTGPGIDSDVRRSDATPGGRTPIVRLGPRRRSRRFDAGLIALKRRSPWLGDDVGHVGVGVGLVWHDADADGVRDADEPRAAGVAVELWNAAGIVRFNTTTSNALGIWVLQAPDGGGPYRVRVRAPADTVPSPKDEGLDDALDSDINQWGPYAEFSDELVFNRGTAYVDIGLAPPVTLGDFVWNDTEADGVQGIGEPGLENVTVQLWNEAKTELLLSTTTNESGKYSFVVARRAASYRIRVIMGPGFTLKDQSSDDTIDSDINPTGDDLGFTDVFTVGADATSVPDIDAGLLFP